ncbi:MAG TPA: tetratricopeptide repeat protein [Acidisarcina sp.]|nr:tetratricopeptide repeat protein [Acidisarcina sp.]
MTRCIAVAFFSLAILPSHGQVLPDAPQTPGQNSSGIGELNIGNPQVAECEVLLRESEQEFVKEDFSSAMAASQRAMAVCQDQTAPLLLLSRSQMLSHQFEAAEQSLHQLLGKAPSNLPALIQLGQVQYLNNHDSDAAKSFQQAIHVAPDQPDPHYWLGRLYYQDGRVQQAIDEFQAAIRFDSAYYKAYDGMGLCYQALGQNGQAAQDFLKGIDLVHKDHPDYDVVYADFAELLLKVNKNKQAFDLASEAASRNSRSPRNFFLAGKALEQDGHPDASLRWLRKAAQMDPAYPDPHYLLARIYRRQGKDAEARQEAAILQTLAAHAPQVRR